MTKAKRLPLIIVLDEMGTPAFSKGTPEWDRTQTIEKAKQVFSPETHSLELDVPNIELDIDRVIFLATGNYEQTDAALEERLPTFKFLTIGEKGLKSAYNDALKASEKRLKEELRDEDVKNILSILGHFETFLFAHYKLPGGRVIKDVVKNLTSTAKSDYFSSRREAGEEFELDQFLAAHEKRYQEIILSRIAPSGSARSSPKSADDSQY